MKPLNLMVRVQGRILKNFKRYPPIAIELKGYRYSEPDMQLEITEGHSYYAYIPFNLTLDQLLILLLQFALLPPPYLGKE